MATSKETKSESARAASAAPNGDDVRSDVAGSAFVKALIVAAVGLGASAALGAAQGDGFRRFSFSYLTAFMWALAICLGALFWVTLQHLVNAKWSVVLRRVGELIASAVPALAVLALPIVLPVFLGHDTLYAWADHDKVHKDHLLHHKAAYLNSGFFLIRFLFYFGFWTALSQFFLKQSLEQDRSGAPDIAKRLQRVAGPGMIVFALSMTFCVIDLVMSLDAYWFSTIFGVYYFASCVLCINSTIALTAMWLQNRGRLKKSVTVEHFHDIGKMMFAFTVFWAYIGFSQFMLIWYANIPEETAWFKERFAGGWGDLSWFLLFGHFVIPFFGLLSRHVKRNRKALAFWACWILGVVYLDMYWLVMPVLDGHVQSTTVPFGLIDVTALIGMAGALAAAVSFSAKTVQNLIPVKDHRLPRSLAFENI